MSISFGLRLGKDRTICNLELDVVFLKGNR